LAVHAEVIGAQAGGRADMNYLLSIIDKTKDGGGKFGMNINFLLRDYICPLRALNYGKKSSPGLRGSPFIGERF